MRRFVSKFIFCFIFCFILFLASIAAYPDVPIEHQAESTLEAIGLNSEESIIFKLRNSVNRGLSDEVSRTGLASITGGIVGSVFGFSWYGLWTFLDSGGASNLVYINFLSGAILKGALLGALSMVSRVYLRSPADFVAWPYVWYEITKEKIKHWVVYDKPTPEIQQDMSVYIDPVATRLKTVVEQIFQIPASSWSITTMAGASPNAVSGTGYKIILYSPIFSITQNQAGLSCVIAHEMGHVLAKHSGQSVLDFLFFQKWGIASIPFTNAISQEREQQADETGIYLTALAGYDPSECVRLWRRMSAATGNVRPIVNMFISTHPTNAARFDEMKKLSNQLKGYYSSKPDALGLGIEYQL
ncbi:M48 family metalloprotease [Endozoicomonas sp.]|uniref:M48 family metalloprotease n=1 Tax=Endozoicomonas sp. TaxID=1892382 RepID=UPI002884D0A1|nr:M48 family metalloprotease [Endozoicomonas sp.]